MGEQRTDTSSWCWQLCSPQPLCLQCSISVSVPKQSTSSSRIDPFPCPKWAQHMAVAPLLKMDQKLLTCLGVFMKLESKVSSHSNNPVFINTLYIVCAYIIRFEIVWAEVPELYRWCESAHLSVKGFQTPKGQFI